MTYNRCASNAFYVAGIGEDMTYGMQGRFFLSIALAAFASLAVSCSTPVEDVAEAPGRSGEPTDTGIYPNLNVPRHAATTQLTPEETEAKLASLRAAQQGQAPGAAVESPEARRKRLQLLQDEQDKTLKVIEGE